MRLKTHCLQPNPTQLTRGRVCCYPLPLHTIACTSRPSTTQGERNDEREENVDNRNLSDSPPGLQPCAQFCSRPTFSGEAVALKANALGVSVALADTGALPSGGGNLSTTVASANVAGIASADTVSSSTSGSGSSSQSQSTLQDVNLLNGP